MSYTLKDVNDAEVLIREIRPETIICRGDYDWSLSIADKGLNSAGVVLFRPARSEGERDLTSTPGQIREACLYLDSQPG